MRAAVSRVVAGYDKRDAAAVCGQISEDAWQGTAATLAKIFGGKPRCTQWIGKSFAAQVSASGSLMSPRYDHVAVVGWKGSSTNDGYGREVAVIKTTYTKPTIEVAHIRPVTIAFWFTHEGGGLRLAQVPPMDRALVGYDSEPLEDLHPIDSSELAAPAELAAPRFVCSGAVTAYPDAEHDAMGGDSSPYHVVQEPWLDIQRVVVHGISGSAPCLDIEFAAPIHPDTVIRVDGPSVAIGAASDVWWTPGLRGVGERGSTLVVGLDPRLAEELSKPIGLCAVSSDLFDPLMSDAAMTFDQFAAGQPSEPSNPC